MGDVDRRDHRARGGGCDVHDRLRRARSAAVADAFVATAIVGLAWAAALAPAARAPRPVAAGRGLFVPVGFGAIALGVLALAVPLHVNAVALGLAVAALGARARADGARPAREPRAARRQPRRGRHGPPHRAEQPAPAADRPRRASSQDDTPHALLLLDLNGFKTYNDSYGHGAGDILLQRLGAALAHAVDGRGDAYRIGGDEFCVLAPLHRTSTRSPRDCAAALATRGDGFSITAAHGAVLLPDEGRDASTRARARRRAHVPPEERRPAAGGACSRRMS